MKVPSPSSDEAAWSWEKRLGEEGFASPVSSMQDKLPGSSPDSPLWTGGLSQNHYPPPPRHIHRAFYYGYQERVDRPEILGNLEKHGRADCCVDTPAPVLMGRNFF